MTLNRIRVVLVCPSHPGNIGAAARAMKTMGLERLVLVNPKKFPHEDATTFASHAVEIVENALVVNSLDEALQGCGLVFGTSARLRDFPKPLYDSREAARKIFEEFPNDEVAIVFGRERTGLLNEELLKCHYHVRIPANNEYDSLNLASAVQVIAYDLRMAFLSSQKSAVIKATSLQLATADELEGLYRHLEEALIRVDFLDPNNPRHMMERFRRLFARALIDKDDLNMLRGFFRSILRAMKVK